MAKTITLTDIKPNRNITLLRGEKGEWRFVFVYVLTDAQGNEYGVRDYTYALPDELQATLDKYVSDALSQIKASEGIDSAAKKL